VRPPTNFAGGGGGGGDLVVAVGNYKWMLLHTSSHQSALSSSSSSAATPAEGEGDHEPLMQQMQAEGYTCVFVAVGGRVEAVVRLL
jgi:hypothetical protein